MSGKLEVQQGGDLIDALLEAVELIGSDKPVIFRDRNGEERTVAKVKVRGFSTVIICEGMDQ